MFALLATAALAVDISVGSGPLDDFTAIQAAVAMAVDGDRIVVAPGIYPIGILITEDIELLGVQGAAVTTIETLGVVEALRIFGAQVTITGFTVDGRGSGRPVYIHGGSSVTLNDIVIVGGSDGGDTLSGWGMRVTGSTVDITDATFVDPVDAGASNGGHLGLHDSSFTGTNLTFSSAIAYTGGAIYGMGGTLVLRGSTFTDNSADYGGAIYVIGCDLDIEGATFANNHTEIGYGGAIRARDALGLTVVRSVFADNISAASGGHIAVQNTPFTALETLFSGGVAAVYGGAVYAESVREVDIDKSDFALNISGDDGGAIHLDAVDVYRLSRNDFCANQVTEIQGDGGAIHLRFSGDETSFISGSNFNSNSAGEGGGAVDCSDGTAMYLHNNTVVGNSSSYQQAAVRNGDTCVASILNNIIAYNTGLGAMDAGLGTAEYNLFYENSEGPSPQFLSDTNLVDVDPAFVAWSADGLCNDDLTLGPGSPAIDGGDPALSDIDGTRSDIGATGGPYGNTPDVAEPTDPTDTGPSDPDTTPESDSTGRSRPSIPAGWFCSATGSLPSSFLVFLAFFAVIRRQR